jgi:hypothetical protein
MLFRELGRMKKIKLSHFWSDSANIQGANDVSGNPIYKIVNALREVRKS